MKPPALHGVVRLHAYVSNTIIAAMSTIGINAGSLRGRIHQMVDGLTTKKNTHHAVLAIESGDRSYRRGTVTRFCSLSAPCNWQKTPPTPTIMAESGR